jgi:beta-lactamase class A
MDRRSFLISTTATAVRPIAGRSGPRSGIWPFRHEEEQARGRLGVCAIDLNNERRIAQRENERFPLASTFKLPLVMAVLSRVDGHRERLDREISFSPRDLIPFSPILELQPLGGSLSIEALCAAAIEHSDNTAGNVLLDVIGGPPTVTSYLRSIGDTTTRLDHKGPYLNRAHPGDIRDTTTPLAMARLLQGLVAQRTLSPASKSRLLTWLRRAKTGPRRIRAGVPRGWAVGDKTGTTDTGASDVAIIWPTKGSAIVLAVYLAEVKAPERARDAAIASVARTVARAISETRAFHCLPSSDGPRVRRLTVLPGD